MNHYAFKAVDSTGNVAKGLLLAKSEQEALNIVSKLGLEPIKVRRAFKFRFLDKLPVKEKIFLARNLQIILKAGLGITEGIRVLIRDLRPGPLKSFLIYLLTTIEKGEPIYQAFAAFPNYFSEIDVEMIKIGEYSGNLTETFKDWAENLERDKEIRNTISSALVYPSIIMSVAFGVVFMLITFVMPRIASLVNQIGQDVPLATKIIVTTSLFIGAHVGWFVFGFVFFIVTLIGFIFSAFGRRLLLQVFTRAPVVRSLALALALRNFCFLLESLLSSGIHLAESLRLIENTIFHTRVKRIIGRVRGKIMQGSDFGEALIEEKYLPGAFSGVLAIASKTGTLTEVLTILREYYEDETKTRVKNLLLMVEPMLLIFIGFVVGGIALSVLIPIYQQISTQLGETGR